MHNLYFCAGMKTNRAHIAASLLIFLCFGCREDIDYIVGGSVQSNAKNSSGHISIISPQLGETWKPGTINSIRWASSASITKVNIELYRKTELREALATSIPNNGSLIWTISPDILKSVHYSIKISNADNQEQFSFSNTFSIR